MKFSEHWLREWVNPPLSTEQLAHQMTMVGLEVDAIEPVADVFEGVVVGEVVSIEAHPNAERLQLCRVDVAATETLSIVCGATNVRVGMRVPVARVGAKLPGGMKIKRAKLRGVESFGMLCSAAELGLAESADGLLALCDDAPVGTDIRDHLFLDDVSIEIGLTPNRGDCLSIAGIAREVGVVSRCDVQRPAVEAVAAAIGDSVAIEISAPQACPRYVGRVIRGIDTAAQTPLWMRERLRRCGVRAISPVVDVTNYVMLELGQPMHAFDLAKLSGGIHVRYAVEGEKITLLDGQELRLDSDSAVIADVHKAHALAGIMGGADSAVGDDTESLFLESAFFAPAAISGRARRYGLHTDSSHRFERGVDPALPRQAMERATALLLAIVGGAAGPLNEVVAAEALPVRQSCMLRAAYLERLIGMTIPADQVRDSLVRLGMEVTEVDGGWCVIPPSSRFDITIEADLVEEAARIYGYDQLPVVRVQAPLTITEKPEDDVDIKTARQLMVDHGYQEVVTYSFVDSALQKHLNPDVSPVVLANPISAEMAEMRTTLWPGLVQALLFNQNRQQEDVRLFETGVKFIPSESGTKETKVIAGVVAGNASPEQWSSDSRAVDYYDIKADVEALLALTADPRAFTFAAHKHPALHPGQSALIQRSDGEIAGIVGALHPALAATLGIGERAFLFELEWQAISRARLPAFQALSKYPAIRRDIAVVVDEKIPSLLLCKCIEKTAGPLLENLQLFDLYQGKGIDSGRKSVAMALTLQAASRTLTDGEVDELIDNVLVSLEREFGAELRG